MHLRLRSDGLDVVFLVLIIPRVSNQKQRQSQTPSSGHPLASLALFKVLTHSFEDGYNCAEGGGTSLRVCVCVCVCLCSNSGP